MSDPTVSAETEAHLFSGYAPPAGAYDELRDETGALRPAWAKAAAEEGHSLSDTEDVAPKKTRARASKAETKK